MIDLNEKPFILKCHNDTALLLHKINLVNGCSIFKQFLSQFFSFLHQDKMKKQHRPQSIQLWLVLVLLFAINGTLWGTSRDFHDSLDFSVSNGQLKGFHTRPDAFGRFMAVFWLHHYRTMHIHGSIMVTQSPRNSTDFTMNI